MDLFELSAKIELDSSEYESAMQDAIKKCDEMEAVLKDAADVVAETEDALKALGDSAGKTKKDTDGLGKSTEDSGESMLKSVIKADLFTSALSKMGEIALDVASYVWNLDEATEEYRVAQGKVNAAFKTAGFSADIAKTAYRGLYRVVGDLDQAAEASQLMSRLARNTEDLANWTTIATGVVGTFGDSLPIESLIESANESARVGQVVGTLADALNWAGMVGEDEFNVMLANCRTQEERVDLITQTLMETYSDAADTFEETSESVMLARDAQLRLAEASAIAGENMADLKNELSTGFSLTAQGWYVMLGRLTGGLAGVAASSGDANRAYEDMLAGFERDIQTGSIQEAAKAMQQLSFWFDALEDPTTKQGLLSTLIGQLGDLGALGFLERIQGLYQQGAERAAGFADEAAAATDGLTESTNGLEEAIEPVIASANGLSVELQGTGLSAEEASSRLGVYTDAALEMFSRIDTESEISYNEMVENLQANIQATQDFAENMASVASDLPPQLAEMFAAGGPEMYAGVVAMLAETNRGADEGLSALNLLWEQGGKAAVDAFIQSLGMVPEDAETPATAVAAQMEEDTSLEQASVDAVARASSAMSESVTSAGFDSSGSLAMMKFVAGMEAQRGAVMEKARSLAQAAKGEIDKVLNGIGGGGGSSGRAGGLDYVPYNGYPATLHAGEAVLTAREADQWRAGASPSGGKTVVINQYIQSVPQTPAELASVTESYFEEAMWQT